METVTPKTISVSELNNYIKRVIDNDYKLQNIFIYGEISNFTNHLRTGHFYMTLKDENASIKAVMFRSYASRIKFMPENGMKVLAFGSVSVFPRDGQYQLYIENMQPDGIGSLNLAFEQLKNKLEAEGLFGVEHKIVPPAYPKVVGVVTSPTGAAFQDVKNILNRRWPLAKILLSPTQVQGETAAGQIVSAIKALETDDTADVIILARGGGSIEDLWPFNEEIVARAIYDCHIPIISGVGHETDFTISDFVADLRAPTPSAAAELAVPDIVSEMQRISSLEIRAKNSMLSRIKSDKDRINRLMQHNVLKSPIILINERRILLDSYTDKIQLIVTNSVNTHRAELALLSGKLDAYSPLKVLARGYGIVKDQNGSIINDVNTVKAEDNIRVLLSNGSVDCTVKSVNPVITEDIKDA